MRRTRTSSGMRLDRVMNVVEETILKRQDPVTSLIANNKEDFPGHAWVRDNLYGVHALWAMYRAYQKSAEFDEDLAKAHELKMECVKIMQSLLECMIRQSDKIERFKCYQRSNDSIHAKFSVHTKTEVVNDYGWGHLQIDAISLFLLTLAQMTASGLQIIRNFDEIAFIQNLVYYIEISYRTADFGVWERGDKTNQGIRELNASSIGMAKSALQALNDVGDLLGDGSKGSIIHVLPDEIQQCSAVLSNMLPRESFSKETDASLLGIISYPAFAVDDQDLIDLTRNTITETLLGKYGCRRFLRDGYKTALEDSSRLYYINAELQKFENIECEWPLFLCYLLLDGLFRKDKEDVNLYYNRLQEIIVSDPYSNNKFIQLVPELYKVPDDVVELERKDHGSQQRVPAGTTPFIWAQSLYVICCLIYDGFLTPSEIDPLSRRLSGVEKRSSSEVQVVVLAESKEIQSDLAKSDIHVQTIDEIDPVFLILPASALAKILERVGESKKLGLTGRPSDRDVGLLSTSRLYHMGQKFVAFCPQFMDHRRSHLIYDISILMDEWSSELQYIYNSWNSVNISGRPLVVLTISRNMLDNVNSQASSTTTRRQRSTVIGALKKIKNGYLGGARVVLKNISEFFRTTSVSKLEIRNVDITDFLSDEISSQPRSLPTEQTEPGKNTLRRYDSIKERYPKQFTTVQQASMRHRSIVMDNNDADLVSLRLAYAQKTHDSSGRISPIPELSPRTSRERSSSPHSHLNTIPRSSSSSSFESKIDHNHMNQMNATELIRMLTETTLLDEQASIVHFLYLKLGFEYDTCLNGVRGVTVRILIEEVYLQACECREWNWVRLMGGILSRQLDDLTRAVTHLLVRQKQITVGLPSKNERAITSPKNKSELRVIWEEAYRGDPNSFTLAQEIIICLGSLVRTEPNLFVEMFRLRVGLIIQVLASELSRIRSVSGTEALQQLLCVSPFELKRMLVSLLSGRLLEDPGVDEDMANKETRTGMGSFRKQIEERKSMRKSKSMRTPALEAIPDISIDDDDTLDIEDIEDEFQFGVWMRHRRIDGALNRVPPNFYSDLWKTVRMFPEGLSINGIVLHRTLTQEMTQREIKFSLAVEQVLNQIAEPEYREMIVEVLTLMRHLEKLILATPNIRSDRPFEVDQVLYLANNIFVEHNRQMNTIVMECCGDFNSCKNAHGLCQHFYDSAPAGEFGTFHYLIRALIQIFDPPK